MKRTQVRERVCRHYGRACERELQNSRSHTFLLTPALCSVARDHVTGSDIVEWSCRRKMEWAGREPNGRSWTWMDRNRAETSRSAPDPLTPFSACSFTPRARQLYKNISMLFLFPVKDGKLSTGVNATSGFGINILYLLTGPIRSTHVLGRHSTVWVYVKLSQNHFRFCGYHIELQTHPRRDKISTTYMWQIYFMNLWERRFYRRTCKKVVVDYIFSTSVIYRVKVNNGLWHVRVAMTTEDQSLSNFHISVMRHVRASSKKTHQDDIAATTVRVMKALMKIEAYRRFRHVTLTNKKRISTCRREIAHQSSRLTTHYASPESPLRHEQCYAICRSIPSFRLPVCSMLI